LEPGCLFSICPLQLKTLLYYQATDLNTPQLVPSYPSKCRFLPLLSRTITIIVYQIQAILHPPKTIMRTINQGFGTPQQDFHYTILHLNVFTIKTQPSFFDQGEICGPQLAGKLDSKKMGDLTVDDLVRQSIYDGILLVKDIAEDIWNKVFFTSLEILASVTLQTQVSAND